MVVYASREEAVHVVKALPSRIGDVQRVSIAGYTEQFPWFGRLWTFYFEQPGAFALDIGIITLLELQDFYVEPDAILLLDSAHLVAGRKAACNIRDSQSGPQRVSQIEFETYHTLTKFMACIHRNQLWYAIEYVSILRRRLFELLRMDFDPPGYIHVGKPERNFESVVDAKVLADLTQTIPKYEWASVVNVALIISRRIHSNLRTKGGKLGIDPLARRIEQLADMRYA